jgi:hypothetical protein
MKAGVFKSTGGFSDTEAGAVAAKEENSSFLGGGVVGATKEENSSCTGKTEAPVGAEVNRSNSLAIYCSQLVPFHFLVPPVEDLYVFPAINLEVSG